MRHHHEEGRGPRGRHDEREHGEHVAQGGGRRQRFFSHGELRLVILDILTRNASPATSLSKGETMTQGSYGPAPASSIRRWTCSRIRGLN